MNIMILDDEASALEELKETVGGICQGSRIVGFNSGKEALEYIYQNPIDIAFLDISMPDMDGMFFARQAKKRWPQINIVFVTGHAKYALESYEIPASSYLLKPVTTQMIQKSLTELRYPVARGNVYIRVQTFGDFEVFVEGKPVHFKRAKSKEILAYLVDRRGTTATVAEIAAVLFEDRPYDRSRQKQMQVFIAELLRDLQSVHAQEMVIRSRNSLSVDASKFYCDYYDYLQLQYGSSNMYHGEYMDNYSWAELRVGLLQRQNTDFENLKK